MAEIDHTAINQRKKTLIIINYDIYQLKNDSSLHSIRFANTKFMNIQNIFIDAGNYNKVYSDAVGNESAAGKKSTDEVLKNLYEKFNMRHPADFRGHSLSVSDVVVLHGNSVVTAHFCNSYRFRQISELIQPDVFVNLDSSGITEHGILSKAIISRAGNSIWWKVMNSGETPTTSL